MRIGPKALLEMHRVLFPVFERRVVLRVEKRRRTTRGRDQAVFKGIKKRGKCIVHGIDAALNTRLNQRERLDDNMLVGDQVAIGDHIGQRGINTAQDHHLHKRATAVAIGIHVDMRIAVQRNNLHKIRNRVT